LQAFSDNILITKTLVQWQQSVETRLLLICHLEHIADFLPEATQMNEKFGRQILTLFTGCGTSAFFSQELPSARQIPRFLSLFVCQHCMFGKFFNIGFFDAFSHSNHLSLCFHNPDLFWLCSPSSCTAFHFLVRAIWIAHPLRFSKLSAAKPGLNTPRQSCTTATSIFTSAVGMETGLSSKR